MADLLTALGVMSGTSLDGIDLALLRTDGEDRVEPGPAMNVPFERELKIVLRRAIKAALEGRDGAADIGKAGGEVTQAYAAAIERFLDEKGVARAQIDVIGLHGQTILHRPPLEPGVVGRTWQIGDGAVVAVETRIDVVNDFRAADMAAGGEGAPFAPVYHRALVAAGDEAGAVGVVNVGGVANVTFVHESRRAIDLLAFDCGPGNGLLDEWLELKTGEAMDRDGALAMAGTVNDEALRMMLLHPFLRRRPPKSLDRYDFKLDHVLKLTPEDGAATLTAYTAHCIARAEDFFPEKVAKWIVCGGGRNNPAIMAALADALDAPVEPAEAAGWRGDDLEAECFAYLAVRSLRKLPLSYPKTTRVPSPVCGGVYHRAPI
ncbi:MAG: anhydro-N-acetylmuramic acid kinase [Pseudomonadota bacterium]